MGFMDGKSRWRTMPWMVTMIGIVVIPLGLSHIILVMSQPVVVHHLSTFALLAALVMLPMIHPHRRRGRGHGPTRPRRRAPRRPQRLAVEGLLDGWPGRKLGARRTHTFHRLTPRPPERDLAHLAVGGERTMAPHRPRRHRRVRCVEVDLVGRSGESQRAAGLLGEPWSVRAGRSRGRAGGGSGIRTRGALAQRFSRPPHSAALPSLRRRRYRWPVTLWRNPASHSSAARQEASASRRRASPWLPAAG